MVPRAYLADSTQARKLAMQRRSIWKILFVGLACFAFAGSVAADNQQADRDFRVETDVFIGSEKQPFAQNLTIFTSGLIYDFPLVGPDVITVFDPVRGRFVLLDAKRKVKTTLTTDHIREFNAAIKARAAEIPGAFAFAANPKFKTSFDEETGWLTLASEPLTYRVKGTEPKSKETVRSYQQFADWYKRLSALRPGGMPPFARIELNRAVASRGWVPDEVELTIVPSSRLLGRNLKVRSRHLFNWRLSNTDEKRVSRAGDHMANFQTVTPDDFWNTREIAARE